MSLRGEARFVAQVRNRPFHSADTGAKTALRPPLLRMIVTPAPAAPRLSPLTRREIECLNWCADGKSYWETAVILGISERTVSFHMEAVRGKLDAATNAHAVAMALRGGVLETGAKTGANTGANTGRAPRQGLR